MKAEILAKTLPALDDMAGKETGESRPQLHCHPSLASPTGTSHYLNPVGSQRQGVH